ncbi:MAG: hypothetical protein K6C99_02320 [Lachnospiraceae bacterium]|nr:hypothetical protein [Lachnospiraceae bacterium]
MSKDKKTLRYKSEPVFLFGGMAILFILAEQSDLLNGQAGKLCEACGIPMLFMAVGALSLIREGGDPSEKELIRENAGYFLCPYFWFSLINGAILAIRVIADDSGYHNTALPDLLYRTLTLYGYSVLWILPALFVALTVCQILKKSLSFKWIFIIIACLQITVALVYHVGNISFTNVVIDSGMSVEGVMVRLAMMFVRSVLAAFFILTGQALVMITDKVKKHRERLLLPGIPLIVAGAFAIALGAGSFYWPYLYFSNAWALLSGTILMTAGLWCICVWIGKVGVINYFGENAPFVYLTFFDLGGIYIAKLAGDEVFALMDNTFASKAALVIVLTAAELIWIKILNIPALAFLTGNVKENKKVK